MSMALKAFACLTGLFKIFLWILVFLETDPYFFGWDLLQFLLVLTGAELLLIVLSGLGKYTKIMMAAEVALLLQGLMLYFFQDFALASIPFELVPLMMVVELN